VFQLHGNTMISRAIIGINEINSITGADANRNIAMNSPTTKGG
jgi:hypothetical protein